MLNCFAKLYLKCQIEDGDDEKSQRRKEGPLTPILLLIWILVWCMGSFNLRV